MSLGVINFTWCSGVRVVGFSFSSPVWVGFGIGSPIGVFFPVRRRMWVSFY